MTDVLDGATVRRVLPQSGLDFNMMLTDTMWGSQNISYQLREKMRARAASAGPGGPENEAAWELLSFMTRDMRLANLNRMFGDVDKCEHFINLSGDLLREGMSDSFAASLARAATTLELSQSVGGFLRRRQNTLTSEQLQGELEPQKRRLLSMGRKEGR